MLSSGWLSSRAFLPVISSINITPKLKTSTLVVTRPVTANISPKNKSLKLECELREQTEKQTISSKKLYGKQQAEEDRRHC
jgi:hypothetical protein